MELPYDSETHGDETNSPTLPSGNLEEALAEHGERVDALIKIAGKYVSTLKAWKKACQAGHMANRRKASAQAAELAPGLVGPTNEAENTWNFDTRAYLSGDHWRRELIATAATKHGLKVLEEQATDSLISSPVVVRSQPARETLSIGRSTWAAIRPNAVADELKRLRDRVASANSQEFLESLYAACQRESRDGRLFIRFKDAYDLFALTPGWKKENPPAKFAQDIYALHRSEIRSTRSGKTFQFEYPSAKFKPGDVFAIVAEDGRSISYYGLWFR